MESHFLNIVKHFVWDEENSEDCLLTIEPRIDEDEPLNITKQSAAIFKDFKDQCFMNGYEGKQYFVDLAEAVESTWREGDLIVIVIIDTKPMLIASRYAEISMKKAYESSKNVQVHLGDKQMIRNIVYGYDYAFHMFGPVDYTKPMIYPCVETNHAAGANLYGVDGFTLKPGESKYVYTNTRIKSFPTDCYGQLKNRFRCCKLGVTGFDGVIDRDYTGEISLYFTNVNHEAVNVSRTTSLQQIIFITYNQLFGDHRRVRNDCAELERF
jgi:dUTPase